MNQEILELRERAENAINSVLSFTGYTYTLEIEKHPKRKRYKSKTIRNNDNQVLQESGFISERHMKKALTNIAKQFEINI